MYKFELDHYRIAFAFADPQIKKRLSPQIANPQSVTFAEGPQI